MNLQVIQLLRQIQNRLKINLQKHVKPFHLKNLLHITAGLTYNYFDCTVLVQSVSPNWFSGRYKNTSKHSTSKNLLHLTAGLIYNYFDCTELVQSVSPNQFSGRYIHRAELLFLCYHGEVAGDKKSSSYSSPLFLLPHDDKNSRFIDA